MLLSKINLTFICLQVYVCGEEGVEEGGEERRRGGEEGGEERKERERERMGIKQERQAKGEYGRNVKERRVREKR